MVIFGLCAFILTVLAVSMTYYTRHETQQNRDQIELINKQNQALEDAFVRGCRVAVGNARDADLAVMEFLQSQLQGRTAAVATVEALQQIVRNKENPDVTCVRPSTKENP